MGLYTKNGRPLQVSGSTVYTKSGAVVGRITGNKVYGPDGRYVGTITSGRLVHRSTDSAGIPILVLGCQSRWLRPSERGGIRDLG